MPDILDPLKSFDTKKPLPIVATNIAIKKSLMPKDN